MNTVLLISLKKRCNQRTKMFYTKSERKSDPLENFFPFFNTFQIYLNFVPCLDSFKFRWSTSRMWVTLGNTTQVVVVTHVGCDHTLVGCDHTLVGFDPRTGLTSTSNDSHSTDVIHSPCCPPPCRQRATLLSTQWPLTQSLWEETIIQACVSLGEKDPKWLMKTAGTCQ